MTTISDFQRSLASPYLWEEKGATGLVAEDLTKAKKWLDEVAAKTDGSDKILMAYQCMYKCADALVHAKGYKQANFRCLLIALTELYVRPGKLGKEDLDLLVKAQELLGAPAESIAAAQAWLVKTHSLTGK